MVVPVVFLPQSVRTVQPLQPSASPLVMAQPVAFTQPSIALDTVSLTPPQLFPQLPQFAGGSFTGQTGFIQPNLFPTASPANSLGTFGQASASAPFNFFGQAPDPFLQSTTSTNPFATTGAPPQVFAATPAFQVTTAAAAPAQSFAASGSNPLTASLQKIASDPVGAKLIAQAHAQHVFIQVGNPGGGQGISNGTQVAGDTTSSNGQTVVTVSNAANIKTIAHELVHAITSQDGDSREEEGIADAIGSQIANNLGGSAAGGLAGTAQQIFLNKQQFYPGLMQTNNVRADLRALGIGVTV